MFKALFQWQVDMPLSYWIISYHILTCFLRNLIIFYQWQVDVPKTQILLGSKGSAGCVLSFYKLIFLFLEITYFDSRC